MTGQGLGLEIGVGLGSFGTRVSEANHYDGGGWGFCVMCTELEMCGLELHVGR